MTALQKNMEKMTLSVSKAASEAGLEPQNTILFCELDENEVLLQQAGESMSDDPNLERCVYDVFDYAGFKLRGKPKALIAIY